jgi:CHASE2 domain-containing sensor protein
MEKSGQVFISYCGGDAEAARRLCAILEEQGLACWIAPRNIPPGEEWPTAIPAAIKRSASMVLLLSSHTGASRQISREVEIADHNFVRVINFRLENVEPPESLEYFLTNRQWIDGFGAHFESGVETLANALRNTAAPITPKVPPAARQKRRPWGKLAWSLAIAFVLALCFQALDYFGWFASSDGRLLNSALTGRSKPVAAADEAVTVLEIDDAAFRDKACFNGGSPLSPPLVMGLVKESLASGPRVIGVDIFTEGDQYRDMPLPANDATVVWMSGSEGDSIIEVANLLQWLSGDHDHIVVKPTNVLGYTPSEWAEHRVIHWGVPAFPQDNDFLIRRFPRRIEVSADPTGSNYRQSFPSWAAQVAQEYCRGAADCIGEAADEVYVSYKNEKPDELKMSDYFACVAGSRLTLRAEKAAAFRDSVHDKALLIGGTFRPSGQRGDFHQTPNGLLAGVVINAYAVRAEIEGSGLHDVRQPWALTLDFAVGILIVLIFHHPLFEAAIAGNRLAWLKYYEFRCMMGASLGLLAVLYAIARWVLPGASYLAGFTGVGLGLLLHQLIEMYWSNPKSRE